MKASRTYLYPLSLMCALALAASGPALASHKKRAAKKRVIASVEMGSLDFDESGRVMEDGHEVKVMAGKPVTTMMIAEVLGTMGAGGQTSFQLRPLEARSKNADGNIEKKTLNGATQSFLYEPSWELLDAHGEVTDDPHSAAKVILPFPEGTNVEAVAMNGSECSGAIAGNYAGLPCTNTRHMSDEFYGFLRDHLIGCVNAGLAGVGGGSATRVHVLHDGTTANSRHNEKSLHAAGRAVDFLELTVATNQGTRKFDFRDTSSKPSGQDRRFYEGFRQCWHKVQKRRGCPDRESGNPVGTIGWEDSHHMGHYLHTSMPFCPNTHHWFTASFGDDDVDSDFGLSKQSDDGGLDI